MMRTVHTHLFQYHSRTVILLAIVAIATALAACGGGGSDGKQTSAPRSAVELTSVSDAPTPGPTLPPAPPTETPVPPPPTPIPLPSPTPVPPYKLALISASCGRSAGGNYIKCEGFVRNISSQPIRSIQALVTIYDSNKTPFASDTGYVEYRPLLVEQQSPFTVLVSYNPAFEYWTVEFKESFGPELLTRDDRPPKTPTPVPRAPVAPAPPVAGMIRCTDGTFVFSTGAGTCSGHGGIAR